MLTTTHAAASTAVKRGCMKDTLTAPLDKRVYQLLMRVFGPLGSGPNFGTPAVVLHVVRHDRGWLSPAERHGWREIVSLCVWGDLL